MQQSAQKGSDCLQRAGGLRPATVSPSGTRLLAECWLGRAAVSPNGTRLSAEGELSIHCLYTRLGDNASGRSEATCWQAAAAG
jgi:hypothetical protein